MKRKHFCIDGRGLLELVILVLLDQFTKRMAVLHLKGTSGKVLIPDVFELYYLENHGAAWGILKDARYFFLLTALILVILIFRFYQQLPKEGHWNVGRFLLILLMAGAVGNAIDRLFCGYVMDFFYISLIDFPVFNVADCYVTLSILVFLIYYRREVCEWIKKES